MLCCIHPKRPWRASRASVVPVVEPRDLAPDGRQTAFYPRLPKNQSLTNHAWLTIPAAPTPDQLLDSSLAARLAPGLSRSRYGAGARREPGCHQPPGAGGGAPDMAIDGTERRRQRPPNAAQQQEQDSGKKKTHTDKNLLLVNEH